MSDKPIIIKKRGEDGHTIISIRMPNDLIEKLDKIATATNRSRNDVMCKLLQHGVDNVIIEE